MHHWPEGVPFPRIAAKGPKAGKSSSKTKEARSLHNLSREHLDSLLCAIVSDEGIFFTVSTSDGESLLSRWECATNAF